MSAAGVHAVTMVIAVDINVSGKKSNAWQEGPVYKNLTSIAGLYPQHTFLFIFDRSHSGTRLLTGNCIPVVSGPGVNSQLMQYFWYNYKLPALLRRHKADIFLGVQGCCSMSAKIPQCLLLGEGVFNGGNHLPGKKNTRFVKKQLPLFLDKAARIIATSNLCREQLVDILPAAAPKTSVVYPAADSAFAPVDEAESEQVKAQYTNGREFFLHGGAISFRSQLINLLKAFSLFKKRQKSNMHLLIAGHIHLPENELKSTIGTYKYRDDVLFTGYLPTPVFARLLGSAYALVHTGTGTQLPAEAMICGVPLVAADTAILQEICGDAALYMNPGSPDSIAEQLMLVFKDENLRNRQIINGKKQVEPCSAPAALIQLAEAVLSAGLPAITVPV